MLSRLSIRDIVLIERLDLDFAPGLSVLTGETGAGKSILLDALSLALGGRGDAGLVREGANQGQVTAVFDVPATHPVRTILRDNAIDDDGDVLLRRVQSADGRTRVFVNDQPASVSLMRTLGHALVEIHGQHDDRALVDADAHRDLLDSFGGLQPAAQTCAETWRRWRDAAQALGRHRAEVEAAAREADFLRASVAELVRLDPHPGEETDLAERRTSMMHAEKVTADIREAQDILGGPASPPSVLAGLMRRLQRKASEAPELLAGVVQALDDALVSLDAAQAGIDAALRAAEFDPQALERAEERLFSLRAAARKHDVAVDDLAELRDEMSARLDDLDAGAERLGQLETALRNAEEAFDRLAGELSERRHAAARQIEAAVMAELPALKLDRAAFIVDIQSDPGARSETGIDRVEFWVRTNPGTRPGPIGKVASGGELSRFLLALKVALADRGSAPTLVFDEIDSGVGGAVSDAIGQRLSRLASTVQVLTVTHAPQVAARADTHFLIAKAPVADRVATTVAELGTPARREEIARMLAGETVTDEARAAAGRLLQAEG
jgi:DNA repair protein RecN (Recombination protein N)